MGLSPGLTIVERKAIYFRFSAPKGLNGIVTILEVLKRQQEESEIKFQCPEGLEWDCHVTLICVALI